MQPSRVTSLFEALGLFDRTANKPKVDDGMIERFARRDLAFDWVHLGTSPLRIAELIQALHSDPQLLPPRTGHVGNWTNIAQARAGPRDYNYVTCGPLQVGYPLIYELNQTEADGPGAGDWSYLPGSLVQGAVRRVLKLYTWDGSCFRQRDREESLFTPFTLADIGGDLVPLVSLHRTRCGQLESLRSRFLSTLLAQRQPLVRQILHVLLEHALAEGNRVQALPHIFDRTVDLSGRVVRQQVEPVARGFRMGAMCYANSEEIIDHAMVPVLSAAFPEDFFAAMRGHPGQMPLLALPTVLLLMAVLNTHYPALEVVPRSSTQPCNPHLHWGGIPMAGFPPKHRGYFRDKGRNLRKLLQPVIVRLPEIDPILFILMPAGIFNLCPHSAYEQDVEILEELFLQVHKETHHMHGSPAQMGQVIEKIIRTWQTDALAKLSLYFVGRFSKRPGVPRLPPREGDGTVVLPASFRHLSIQQATMMMGSMTQLNW